MQTKAISAVIATIMLLMISVSLISVFYVFSSTLASTTTSSGGQQASQLTAQLSMCMQIDNIAGNRVTLRNCGKGVIENKSLIVMMDDVALGANTQTIQEGNSSVVNISGLWQVPFGKHSLKISNGAAVAQSLVEIIPNPDGLAGSWNFDEGSGSKAYDGSGNGNIGTLTNINITGNATSGWTAGKFGNGLQFDGADDYVTAGNSTDTSSTNTITVAAWVKSQNLSSSHVIVERGRYFGFNRGFRLDETSGKWAFYVGNGTVSDWVYSNNIANIDTWYHVTGIYNSSLMTIYINGILQTQTKSTVSGSININSGNSDYHIGSQSDVGTAVFNGTIDEVRVWNKALSPDETVVMKRII